jgi:hypothetical protein
MNKILLICLLGLSLPANALTKQEQVCASQNIYFEARGDKSSWLKVLQVANNRKQHPKKYGAKSSNLCDIVHSSQYTTRRFKRIKELKTYKEITLFVSRHKQPLRSNLTYFGGHHKLHFRSRF